MVPHRHRVEPERAHYLQLGNAEVVVKHEIADEGVSSVEENDVLLGRPDRAEYIGRLGDPPDRPVQMAILRAERIEMRMRVVDVHYRDCRPPCEHHARTEDEEDRNAHKIFEVFLHGATAPFIACGWLAVRGVPEILSSSLMHADDGKMIGKGRGTSVMKLS